MTSPIKRSNTENQTPKDLSKMHLINNDRNVSECMNIQLVPPCSQHPSLMLSKVCIYLLDKSSRLFVEKYNTCFKYTRVIYPVLYIIFRQIIPLVRLPKYVLGRAVAPDNWLEQNIF